MGQGGWVSLRRLGASEGPQGVPGAGTVGQGPIPLRRAPAACCRASAGRKTWSTSGSDAPSCAGHPVSWSCTSSGPWNPPTRLTSAQAQDSVVSPRASSTLCGSSLPVPAPSTSRTSASHPGVTTVAVTVPWPPTHCLTSRGPQGLSCCITFTQGSLSVFKLVKSIKQEWLIPRPVCACSPWVSEAGAVGPHRLHLAPCCSPCLHAGQVGRCCPGEATTGRPQTSPCS